MQLSIFSIQEPVACKKPLDKGIFMAAAQFVTALNFADEFELLSLSAVNTQAGTAKKGGLVFVRNGKLKMHPEIYDHLALISISSICAGSVYIHGRDKIAAEIVNLPYSDGILNLAGAEEDYMAFKRLCSPVSRFFLLHTKKVQWSAILSVFRFFMIDGIWDVVNFVAQRLQQADADVLSCAQLLGSMLEQEWYPVFYQSLQDFHVSRYPLSKVGLTLELPEMA
ncbi:hypothetical protein SAMN05421827_1207 [Pedobacter terrae]|uniref:Uncharacterized protein n=1 Tax=Pedobacter terrae TaxID=405671 RepID=A0A1G8AUJ3_9SPHI|nr:hypothetical protein [Pedobacter terrae]SDH24436.1 hypothetical protein SAMN05421827_1207 [Pedobacter terrae]